MTETTASNIGTVTQVIGSTLDAEFDPEHMPAIYNGLKVNVTRVIGEERREEVLWCEVAQHLGGGQIRAVAPKVIVTLGNPATQNLLNTRTGITRLRGQWQELPEIAPELAGTAVMPTFHPSYVLRQYNQDTRGKVWSDLQQVMHHLGLKLPTKP